MNKIQEFIKNNSLDFSGSGSELNSNCTIISGYALFIGISYLELVTMMEEDTEELSIDVKHELSRVFDFAKRNNYGQWWNKPENAERYKI